MYPTDVVKTRAQLSTTKTEGMLTVMKNIFKQEGYVEFNSLQILCTDQSLSNDSIC
jgi:hypothetical protein